MKTIDSAAIALSSITLAANNVWHTTSSEALSLAESMGDVNYDRESEKLPEVYHSPPPELDEDDLQSEEEESDEPERAPSHIKAANPIATEGSNHWSVSPTQSDDTQWSTPSPQSLKELIKNILID